MRLAQTNSRATAQQLAAAAPLGGAASSGSGLPTASGGALHHALQLDEDFGGLVAPAVPPSGRPLPDSQPEHPRTASASGGGRGPVKAPAAWLKKSTSNTQDAFIALSKDTRKELVATYAAHQPKRSRGNGGDRRRLESYQERPNAQRQTLEQALARGAGRLVVRASGEVMPGGVWRCCRLRGCCRHA